MSSGGSGANSYWPGFVDALTNVVIAMVFVIVVLAISLSFAAQMMGKKLAEKYIKEHAEKTALAAPAKASPPAQAPVAESVLPAATRIAVAGNERAASSAGGTLRRVRNSLALDFAPGAMTLDTQAEERFRAALAALGGEPVRRRVELVATGPAMQLSDNQRTAYLRVMAVRNALLDQGVKPDRIQVRIDTDTEVASASVNVVILE